MFTSDDFPLIHTEKFSPLFIEFSECDDEIETNYKKSKEPGYFKSCYLAYLYANENINDFFDENKSIDFLKEVHSRAIKHISVTRGKFSTTGKYFGFEGKKTFKRSFGQIETALDKYGYFKRWHREERSEKYLGYKIIQAITKLKAKLNTQYIQEEAIWNFTGELVLLHPFADGNGRTFGILILNALRKHYGYHEIVLASKGVNSAFSWRKACSIPGVFYSLEDICLLYSKTEKYNSKQIFKESETIKKKLDRNMENFSVKLSEESSASNTSFYSEKNFAAQGYTIDLVYKVIRSIDIYIAYNARVNHNYFHFYKKHSSDGIIKANNLKERLLQLAEEDGDSSDVYLIRELRSFCNKDDIYNTSGRINVNDHSCLTYILRSLDLAFSKTLKYIPYSEHLNDFYKKITNDYSLSSLNRDDRVRIKRNIISYKVKKRRFSRSDSYYEESKF